MTAFLSLHLLRAQAAPRLRWQDAPRGRAPRPHLVAVWRQAEDGRLTCRWLPQDRPSG